MSAVPATRSSGARRRCASTSVRRRIERGLVNKNVASATTGSTGPGWGINMKKKRSSQPLSRKAHRAAEGSDPLGPVMGGGANEYVFQDREGSWLLATPGWNWLRPAQAGR